MSQLIRVDEHVYGHILKIKHELERARGGRVSMSDAIAEALRRARERQERRKA